MSSEHEKINSISKASDDAPGFIVVEGATVIGGSMVEPGTTDVGSSMVEAGATG